LLLSDLSKTGGRPWWICRLSPGRRERSDLALPARRCRRLCARRCSLSSRPGAVTEGGDPRQSGGGRRGSAPEGGDPRRSGGGFAGEAGLAGAGAGLGPEPIPQRRKRREGVGRLGGWGRGLKRESVGGRLGEDGGEEGVKNCVCALEERFKGS
jgi:hypothetical protein